jgi:hypothetical protein
LKRADDGKKEVDGIEKQPFSGLFGPHFIWSFLESGKKD